ncbi:hypothetical protein [Streptomyces sp. NPDC055709]
MATLHNAMVAAFGAGMALTLTGAGLIVLRGRDALLDRVSRSSLLHTWTPGIPPLRRVGGGGRVRP